MSPSGTASTKLRSMVSAETAALIAVLPVEDRRLAILEICRAIDLVRVAARVSTEARELSRWGTNKALKLCLDGFGKYKRTPLVPSSRETFEWSHAFLQQCGRIALCEQYLDYEASGLGEFSHDGTDFRFLLTPRFVGTEMLDVAEFTWFNAQLDALHQPVKMMLDDATSQIDDTMRDLVHSWETHYIGYDTSPEIDEFYKWRGILLARQMPGHDAFANDDKFGGIDFEIYRAAAWTLVGWGMKHEHFAFLLSESDASLDAPNLVTITSDVCKVAEQMGAALGTTPRETEAALSMLEARPNDPPEVWTNGHFPPPLLRVAEEQYIRCLCGALGNPFSFMLTQLRRFHRSDWDSAVNGREQRFRDELYGLFKNTYMRPVDSNINLKIGSKRMTDIDGAVWDSKTATLGLFQLKWQDMFGNSMRQRASRMKNMQTEVSKWIEGVNEYLRTATPEEIRAAFRLPKDCAPVTQYLLFVVGRNATHFSGDHRPDDRAAWAVWPQLARVVSQLNSQEWGVEDLHKALIAENPHNADIELGTFSFNLQDITIHLPGVAVEESSVRGAKS